MIKHISSFHTHTLNCSNTMHKDIADTGGLVVISRIAGLSILETAYLRFYYTQ